MLRRLKSDVEKSLPPKIEMILYVGMSQLQRNLYKSILSKNIGVLTDTITSKKALLNTAMQLRKVCNHPYLFEGVEDRSLPVNGSHVIDNAAKLRILNKLLPKLQEEGNKCLIFCQMRRMLDILDDYCFICGYKRCRIDGNTMREDRQSQMDDFNRPNSDKFIFLLSTRAGGLDINLVAADCVIFYDSDWNFQMDLRAQCRTHRIGQTKPIKIFRLITKNTIEEKILQRAQFSQLQLNLKVNKAVSKEEILSIVKHGVDQIMKLKDVDNTLTQMDQMSIEQILNEGKEASTKLKALIAKQVKNNSSLSEDCKLDNDASRAMTKFKQQNDSSKNQNVNAMNDLKAPEKAPKMHYFQFFNVELLTALYEKQWKWYETYKNVKHNQIPRENCHRYGLTEYEYTLKQKLTSEAFGDWNYKHFWSFIKCCCDDGRQSIDELCKALPMKTRDEIRRYSNVFFANKGNNKEIQKKIADISFAEQQLERYKKYVALFKKKISLYQYPEQQMDFAEAPYDDRSHGWRIEHDRFIIITTTKIGYGCWNELCLAFSNSKPFRFDYFARSRSRNDITKRMRQLRPSIEKEFGVNIRIFDTKRNEQQSLKSELKLISSSPPDKYLCFECKLIGDHWIMNCPLKLNRKQLSLSPHVLTSQNVKQPKVMWIYRKIVAPMIEDIFKEKLPCPVRQHDIKNLMPDHLISNCVDDKPPNPTWLNHIIYKQSDNTKTKMLTDPWIGDALMIYDFLFRYKRLLKMDETFTISEWIGCIKLKHETFLFNYIFSIFVNVLVNKNETRSRDRSQLFDGYKCTLLTWPSLLKIFLLIRKRTMLLADRSKHHAFNDIIDSINNNKPNIERSTACFSNISSNRKIELLTMMMQHIIQDTKMFRYEFQRIISESDKARGQYVQYRNKERQRMLDEVQYDDKIMRGLHRSIPVHWNDFDIICQSHKRGDKMNKDFMDRFFMKFFHSMSLNSISQTELNRYKNKLNVLIKIKNELEDKNEMLSCAPLQNVTSDPKTKITKEKWRDKVKSNVEKIFAKYINDFVMEPNKAKLQQQRDNILKKLIEEYNETNALSLGYDRYNNRYWILANNCSKIIVENINANQWGYFDSNKQIYQLAKFLNSNGRNESTLKINLMEKDILFGDSNNINTKWNLTPWTLQIDELLICGYMKVIIKQHYNAPAEITNIIKNYYALNKTGYPDWRDIVKYEISKTNFYKYIVNNDEKNIAYNERLHERNINVAQKNDENIPYQISVIKYFLLDLQWVLGIEYLEESPVIHRNLISIDELAVHIWKLFCCIDVSSRKKWLNVNSLKTTLLYPTEQEPRTYSEIMLCLHIIDKAIDFNSDDHVYGSNDTETSSDSQSSSD